jgi:ABC-type Na+ transport system ATPase subunit NatA
MSETRAMPKIPEGVFNEEQLQRISGGLDVCSAQQLRDIVSGLQENYETLIGFTSYVIERVADALPGGSP